MQIQGISFRLPKTFSGFFLWFHVVLFLLSFYQIGMGNSNIVWEGGFRVGLVGTLIGAIMHYFVEPYVRDIYMARHGGRGIIFEEDIKEFHQEVDEAWVVALLLYGLIAGFMLANISFFKV